MKENINREPLFCSCCKEKPEVMAFRRSNSIVIYDKRHGQLHFLILDLTEALREPIIKATE